MRARSPPDHVLKYRGISGQYSPTAASRFAEISAKLRQSHASGWPGAKAVMIRRADGVVEVILPGTADRRDEAGRMYRRAGECLDAYERNLAVNLASSRAHRRTGRIARAALRTHRVVADIWTYNR